MKYAIKLTNTVQNSYNEQRSDGLLTEFDIHNDEYSDDHKVALFDTKGDALAAIETLRFIDNPTLEAVEVTIAEGVDLTIPRLYDEVNSAVASDFRESLRRVDLEGAYQKKAAIKGLCLNCAKDTYEDKDDAIKL